MRPYVPISTTASNITGLSATQARNRLHHRAEVETVGIQTALRSLLDFLPKQNNIVLVGRNIFNFDAYDSFMLNELNELNDTLLVCVDALPLF